MTVLPRFIWGAGDRPSPTASGTYLVHTEQPRFICEVWMTHDVELVPGHYSTFKNIDGELSWECGPMVARRWVFLDPSSPGFWTTAGGLYAIGECMRIAYADMARLESHLDAHEGPIVGLVH